MYYFLAVSRENTEKALLISLIVVLGIILYMKLIRSLKKKRLNDTFSSIDSYDVENKELVVRYTIPGKIDSKFDFHTAAGDFEISFPITQSQGGQHEFRVSIGAFSQKLVVLSFQTENQKITKRIRLDV
ncbi:MAG: hypothetical protein AB8B53_03425 [Flavobacteriales bacterium]